MIWLLIQAHPETFAAELAYQFASSSAQAGRIKAVFFHGEGAWHCARQSRFAQNWADLSQKHQFSLQVCSSAALRRSLDLSDQAQCVAAYVLAGLGQLVTAQLEAKHLIQFNA